MNFSIHGDHIKVTESIKEYIESKISKLGKYFDNESEIEERHEDLYAAVDLVQKKLESQIKKNKSKMQSKYKNKKGYIMAEEEMPEEEAVQIVRRKEIEFKPMDEDEAILQMELTNHDFFVFKNADEKCTSVVYKRKDGTYGIINAR